MFRKGTGSVMIDMVACLIISRSNILNDSIKHILLQEFYWAEYEFCEEEGSIISYLWNVQQMDVWQIVLLFEVSHVQVGYGFGPYKNSARREAENKLVVRSAEFD